jgi:hypothetical protein
MPMTWWLCPRHGRQHPDHVKVGKTSLGREGEASAWPSVTFYTSNSKFQILVWDGRGIEAYTFIPRHPCGVRARKQRFDNDDKRSKHLQPSASKGVSKNFNTIFKVINCVGTALLCLNEFC